MSRALRAAVAATMFVAAVPLVLAVTMRANALENGLGRTPQMGWNEWNTFGCNSNDALIRAVADAMVSTGMAAAGYQYVNLDDCWSSRTRNADGTLQPDPAKFPNGIKAVADYVHSKGMKMGIYSSAGTTTCSGYPGSIGFEAQDARTWASWGIDYLKYDNCGDHRGQTSQQRYTAMRDALAATGRPIFYSIVNWGQDEVWTWGRPVGNSWRTTGDITDNWGSVMSILDSQVGLEAYSGPGGWNDPDMLEVGNPGLTDVESRSHFSLWALLNAPLLAGNDLRNMSETTLSILTNTDVIAVNQDWGGKQGYKLRDDGDSEVWIKPMSNGSKAVLLLNRGGGTATISVTATALGLPAASSYSVRDLWAHTTSTSGGTIGTAVASHAAAMYVVSGGGSPPATSQPPSSPPATSQPPSSPPVSTPPPAGPCTARYRTVNSWPGGFQAEVTITAGQSLISGWTASWTLAAGQGISQTWNATLTAAGTTATASNLSYNGSLGPNGSTQFGFLGTGSPSTPAVACATP